jgi:ketosteroid isomerase-like protein
MYKTTQMKLLFIAPLLLLIMTTQAQSKQETEVANVIERLRIAMVDANRADLNAIASEKLSYGHSTGRVENKQEFVENIASGKSDFVSIELKDQTISVSGNTAVARHELHAKTNDGGKPGEAHIKILLVFQKQGGKWLLLARQAVKMV